MTTDIMNPDDGDLSNLSADDLRRELYRCLGFSAAGVRRAANIVRRLEEMGEDITDLKTGLVRFLRRIGAGQMLPEVLVRFAGSSELIRRVGCLPLADQRRLCEGESLPVATFAADGTFTHVMIQPEKMATGQLKQVFDRGAIRDDAEQRAYLEDRRTKRMTRPPRSSLGRATVDRDRDGAELPRGFYSRDELKRIVRELGKR